MELASAQKRMMLISRAGSKIRTDAPDRRCHNGWLRDARLSALVVLQCPDQVQMPSR
jgi:hypothetical protein